MVSSVAECIAAGRDGRFDLGHVSNLHRELERGNPRLIWGWKRDVGANNRMVYFGGELVAAGDRVMLGRWYLFYRHRAEATAIEAIYETLHSSEQLGAHILRLDRKMVGQGLADLRLDLGTPTDEDSDRVRRLQLRRPRRRFAEVVMPTPAPLQLAAQVFPADIYVGSGLSYEAGLPTLCDMHLAFGVDSADCTRFATGADDTLPARLAMNLADAIGSFCSVHVGALRASPTPAMQAISDLRASGWVRKVFTDNIDNMLAKVGVPFERTRGSGVFNERYPARFESDRLIVSASLQTDAASSGRRARRGCRFWSSIHATGWRQWSAILITSDQLTCSSRYRRPPSSRRS
jgi:hypothetical protein